VKHEQVSPDRTTPDGEHSRVCFISLTSYAYFNSEAEVTPGGAERQLYLLGQESTGEFDIHFVVGDYGQRQTEVRDGMTLHRAYTPGTDVRLARRPRQIYELYRAMERASADVYVFRGHRTKAAVTYALARLLDAKWVYNISVDSLADADGEGVARPQDAVFDRMLADADGIITQSQRQQRLLSDSFGVDSTVVPNGYPPRDGDIATESRDCFLYVGRLDSEQKRPHLFLDLAQRLPEEEFVLIGPTDFEESYAAGIERRAAALPNVDFRGRVAPEKIHDYYERATALVNTSASEGFPNTFLEAWRCETPVLSLDVDPGRFIDSDAGCHAAGDMDRLVEMAERLATERDRREAMGALAREQFEANYTVEEVARRYGDVFESCLDMTVRQPGSD